MNSADPIEHSTPAPQSALAQIPRAVSAKAKWRLWAEPAVRSWWLSAAALLLITLWILIEQFSAAINTRWRIDRWTHIDSAIIERVGTTNRKSRHLPVDEMSFTTAVLSYTDAAGKKHELTGKLEGQSASVSPEQHVPILINPENPTEWTDIIGTKPLLVELMVPLLMLLIPFLFAAVAFWRRQRWLELWRMGIAREAVVTDGKQSAIAPRSIVYRCTLRGSEDKRLIRVTIPRSARKLSPGDTLWIIVPRAEPSYAIAAMLYE